MTNIKQLSDIKLPLKKSPIKPNFKHLPWASSLPFVDNKYALLIHRPLSISTFNSFKTPHIAVKAHCGNTFTGSDKFTFLSQLENEGKLLCARCEMLATERGLPSADLLSGKHIHLGKLKPIKTCCIEVKDTPK